MPQKGTSFLLNMMVKAGPWRYKQPTNKLKIRIFKGLYSKGCWFESTVLHYFSSNSVCLFAHVFTGEDP